ncbi:hypothetical protein [Hyalangium gracile]|uniref:hypothetical protein n=1 Tax=Hyalangium gracile TaxID=394092 RepID=UPI001CCE3ABA|nr:hypothetical protein [Hyalangium gracile]
MSHVTTSTSPGFAPPLPRRESQFLLALSRLGAWVKEQSLFAPHPATRELEPAERPGHRARPMMAAAWYGSLGPGPMCLPGQPAMSFDPGYRD